MREDELVESDDDVKIESAEPDIDPDDADSDPVITKSVMKSQSRVRNPTNSHYAKAKTKATIAETEVFSPKTKEKREFVDAHYQQRYGMSQAEYEAIKMDDDYDSIQLYLNQLLHEESLEEVRRIARSTYGYEHDGEAKDE